MEYIKKLKGDSFLIIKVDALSGMDMASFGVWCEGSLHGVLVWNTQNYGSGINVH